MGDPRRLVTPDIAATARDPTAAKAGIFAMHHATFAAAQMAEEVMKIRVRIAGAVEIGHRQRHAHFGHFFRNRAFQQHKSGTCTGHLAKAIASFQRPGLALFKHARDVIAQRLRQKRCGAGPLCFGFDRLALDRTAQRSPRHSALRIGGNREIFVEIQKLKEQVRLKAHVAVQQKRMAELCQTQKHRQQVIARNHQIRPFIGAQSKANAAFGKRLGQPHQRMDAGRINMPAGWHQDQ